MLLIIGYHSLGEAGTYTSTPDMQPSTRQGGQGKTLLVLCEVDPENLRDRVVSDPRWPILHFRNLVSLESPDVDLVSVQTLLCMASL